MQRYWIFKFSTCSNAIHLHRDHPPVTSLDYSRLSEYAKQNFLPIGALVQRALARQEDFLSRHKKFTGQLTLVIVGTAYLRKFSTIC